MKIIFMGTPEFAVPGLQKIQEAGVEIGAVVTRPDRRAGRGRKVQPPAVKTAAERLGLKTVQPKRWEDSDLINILEEISPDLMVVSAYGRFIPRRILKKAGKGGINLHPSLLPRYRGAAPIQWALINGETETGVTVIEVADEMDAGDIYGQRRVSIRPEDTASTLFRRLAEEGGDLLVEVLSAIASGRDRRIAQDENLATFAPRLTKEDGWIDWSLPAQAIYNRFRGTYPWPGSRTCVDRTKGLKMIKIHACAPAAGTGPPGSILETGEGGVVVAAGRNAIRIKELQLEGKRKLPAGAFLRGFVLETGETLGASGGERE